MPLDIDITIENEDWPDLETLIEETALFTLKQAKGQTDAADISVVLADNDFVQDLNKRYRNKDKPTNVLSFPQEEQIEGHISYGDLIFALETIQKEADEQGKSFEDHFRHLIVHGTLHLLGYDHEDDQEAEEMEALEVKILSGMNVKNPYEAQGSVA